MGATNRHGRDKSGPYRRNQLRRYNGGTYGYDAAIGDTNTETHSRLLA